MVLQKIEDDWNIRLASQEFTRDGKIPSLMMVMKCRSGKCLNPIPFYMLPCMSVTPYIFINRQQLVETLSKVGKKGLIWYYNYLTLYIYVYIYIVYIYMYIYIYHWKWTNIQHIVDLLPLPYWKVGKMRMKVPLVPSGPKPNFPGIPMTKWTIDISTINPRFLHLVKYVKM